MRWPRVGSPHLDDRPTLGPFEKPKAKTLSIITRDTPFPADEVLHGTIATPELCAQTSNGLWLEVDGQGDCIRYYAFGLTKRKNPQVLVFFGGDVLLMTSKGVRYIAPSYQTQCPARIEAEMAEWSRKANTPAVFVARPGLHGSSGDHHMRRQPREIALMDQALDALKQRYNIGSFILAGQSGGGQIVAALLSRREDVLAAVMASSLLSVRQAAAHWAYQREIPARFLYDADRFYDPLDDIGQIPRNPAPAIYVISDPEDQVVPFRTQLRFVRSLRQAEFDAQHIFAHAPAPMHHVLTEHARLAAALVARGATPQNIRAKLNELDWAQTCKQRGISVSRRFQRYSPPNIDAESAISLNVESRSGEEHELLFEKSSFRRLPPASLTKIMTVVVMLDLVPRFGITLADHLRIDEGDIAGGSGANLKPGEKIAFRDAIANLMLPSSNITANAVARTFGQLLLDEQCDAACDARARFVAEMNAKAAHLRMRYTQFRNPSGQPARGQLTTAVDMAQLMLTAMQYPELAEIWCKSVHVMQVAGLNPHEQKIHSTVKVIDDYDVLGGKTGTLLPDCCNVAVLSEAPNRDRLVTVILRAPDQTALYADLRCILDAVKRGRDWVRRAPR